MSQIPDERQSPGGQLGEAMKRLIREVEDGLQHGFFEYQVSCELVKNRKRRLVINAGKKHQFTIPEDELGN